MLTSSNWKERNAGVLEVESILKEASNRIQPNVGELLSAMKVGGYLGGPGGWACLLGGVELSVLLATI